MSRRLKAQSRSMIDRLGRPGTVINARRNAEAYETAATGSYEDEAPEWAETTSATNIRIEKSTESRRVSSDVGAESIPDVEIWVPDSEVVTDGDDDTDVRATRIRDDATGDTYEVLEVFLEREAGLYRAEARQD